MKSPKLLTISQLTQRVDEVQTILDKLTEKSEAKSALESRLKELQAELNIKTHENTFNKNVITPLPPEHVDVGNEAVITPKAPAQVERERNEWEKNLENG